MVWPFIKAQGDNERRAIREVILRYEFDPKDVRYNIFRGQPYTIGKNDICVVAVDFSETGDSSGFVAKFSGGSVVSQRIPMETAVKDKALAIKCKYSRTTLYEMICNQALIDARAESSKPAPPPIPSDRPTHDPVVGGRTALMQVAEGWRDGNLTDDQLRAGFGAPLEIALRKLAGQWCDGDLSDDEVIARLVLAADILLGNRDAPPPR